jgi:acetyltransferase-like isoleucine patch superfamily enzyme
MINEDREVIVGNRNWIGCRTTVLKGTKVGDNCVIGANSFLNKSFQINNV